MTNIERLRQYIGKASFASGADKYTVLECLREIEQGTATESGRFVYKIDHPGELGAGIIGFCDEVIITVASGDPGGDHDGEDGFQEHMLRALREWYDGAEVRLV